MIYLDNNATTPPDPAVVEAMQQALVSEWGNPSSPHMAGQLARHAVDQARRRVAALIQADPGDVVFTGSGTEADNTAIVSALRNQPHRRHLVLSACEHDAVLRMADELARAGWQVTRVLPDCEGVVHPQAVASAMRPDTALVCVMLANNETGVINPIESISVLTQRNGTQLLVDATQALGKIPVSIRRLGATWLTGSAHKLHGPKGCGVLVLGRLNGAPPALSPFVVGGGQEDGRRAGTENTPGIVGFGMAAARANSSGTSRATQEVGRLRDRLEALLKQAFGDRVKVLGERAPRLWNTSLVAFRDTFNRTLQDRLSQQGICVGIGSACSCLKNPRPSATVAAMGVPQEYQLGTIRFSFHRYHAPSMGGDAVLPDQVVAAIRSILTAPAAPSLPNRPARRALPGPRASN